MPTPSLSMKEIRSRAAKFAARWSGSTYEIGDTQSFWNEFLGIYGIDRKRVAFFEKRAERLSTGSRGRIDMFWPGMLLVEQKSAGLDLDAAEDQAFDYLGSLTPKDFPQAIVTSDFARIRLTRFHDDGIPTTHTLHTRDLEKEIDRFTFLAGYVKRDFSAKQEEAVNAVAVKLMGRLYTEITGDHFSDHETSVFMTRVLFLLFGDDTGLWQRGLFQQLVEESPESGEALAGSLDALFRALDRPVAERSPKLSEQIEPFPFVNGGLFHEHLEVPAFDSAMRTALLECCRFDWGAISPDVFGSMFQAVKAKADRRAHGEHYTTPENIAKTIDPLFLDGFRRELAACGTNLTKLRAFHKSLADYTYFDPACGCGNFLVVAYREMRGIELEVLRKIRDVTNNEVLDSFEVANTLNVRPDQFFGIEIEEWPAAIAQTALFLVDHQANMTLSQEFGEAPDRLPIKDSATILIANAITTDWKTFLPPTNKTLVFGNPPFVGMSWLTKDQQDDNRIAFAQLTESKGERTGRLDYVACWYAKAIEYSRGVAVRFAFVSTNSITQGDQARALDPIFRKANMAIDFGHRTFKWTSGAANAAAVFCTIIGFSRDGTVKDKRLFDYPDVKGQPLETRPTALNFYLLDSVLPGPAKRKKPLVTGIPAMVQGSKPWDGNNLTVTVDDYASVMADARAAKYVRPYRQGKEMLNSLDRWCLWLVGAAPGDLISSPVLKERLQKVVDERLKSPTAAVRAQASTPSLFVQVRQPAHRYLALPEVSSENREYIPMRFYEPDVIAGNKLMVIENCPLWLFGYLQSSAFTNWVKTFAGRLKADPSISPDLTYSVFPFVVPTPKQLESLTSAAQVVLDARNAYPDESLATLYSPLAMPAELHKAHENLDRVVNALYGLTKPTESAQVAALLQKHHDLAAPAAGLFEMPGTSVVVKTRKK
jgi:hypothetical protein